MSHSGEKQLVTILGATGTIGINTLDVLSRHPDDYAVFALTANTNADRLLEQCKQYQPQYAVMHDVHAAMQLEQSLKAAGLETQVKSGLEGLEFVSACAEVDTVMAAIVGAAGLLPTLAAAKAGKRILLANKEALVMSGQVLIDAVRDNNATLLPIDSEHNAIFQCLPITETDGHYSPADADYPSLGIDKILLTASGGPFRKLPLEQLEGVTPEQAVKHPNWVMGQKISIDSATMMNKGLELIEACWLFNISPQQIQVVLHPESVIHSMVSYVDGSVLAQLGNPDMRTPIANALGWPKRIAAGVEPLDIFQVAQLNFETPDFQRFPCLELAYHAYEAGGTSTAILNAANEVAVEAFLNKKIRFTDIAKTIADTLGNTAAHPADNLEVILQDDAMARDNARAYIAQIEL